MTPELPVREPSETRIEEPPGAMEALAAGERPEDVAARHPDCLAAWADLGERALEEGASLDAYAYFRVGYHRGLDRLRKSGWRGSGVVPWGHGPNRGFLRSVAGLGRAARALGETEEAERCAAFVAELAPDRPTTG